MARLRLFASAREEAGVTEARLDGDTVEAVLDAAVGRFGLRFGQVLDGCRIWLNGEPAEPGDRVDDDDEIAVLPPVSGGG